MRILSPALRSNPSQKRASRLLAFMAIGIGLLAAGAKPAFANHVDTAQVSASCTSYTIQVTAAQLVSGKSYTVTYKMTYTPASGTPTVVTGSIPVVGPSNGTYSTSVTKPVNLITDTYKLTGTATLTGYNTINISFTPTSLACSCPD